MDLRTEAWDRRMSEVEILLGLEIVSDRLLDIEIGVHTSGLRMVPAASTVRGGA